MKYKSTLAALALTIIALACLISGAAFATDVRGHKLPQLIGDWMVAEYPDLFSDDMSYKMTAASVWNYDKDGRRSNCFAGVDDCYKPTLMLICDKDHRYSLSFVAVCQSCGAETTLPVSVSLDANRQLDLQGVDSDHTEKSAGMGSAIDVSLNAEQVQALSQARRSILVSPLNRGPIYAQPNGTASAFAMLDAVCHADRKAVK